MGGRRVPPSPGSPVSAGGESDVWCLGVLDAVAADAFAVWVVVVDRFEVPRFVGSAFGERGDVVGCVGSGFAADVADVGCLDDAAVAALRGLGCVAWRAHSGVGCAFSVRVSLVIGVGGPFVGAGRIIGQWRHGRR